MTNFLKAPLIRYEQQRKITDQTMINRYNRPGLSPDTSLETAKQLGIAEFGAGNICDGMGLILGREVLAKEITCDLTIDRGEMSRIAEIAHNDPARAADLLALKAIAEQL